MSHLDEELNSLLEVLPPLIKRSLISHHDISSLVEVVLDLGKSAEARFSHSVHYFQEMVVSQDDIDYVVGKVGDFTSDNRAGVERTLHRISCLRNRRGKIIGLTCRVGRTIIGTIDIIRDVVESGKNVLFVGPPGSGKTTKLREAARVLSEQFKKRVIVVDTSNEIAGDGDIPHPAIGSARRMQVPSPDFQHKVMIEAVENHMPEVVIVDEIGTEAEAAACKTIAERGVQLIGTAHGVTFENIISNPTLTDLVGGIQSVILGDEEAKRRHTQKAILERKGPPAFDIGVEIQERDKFAIYGDVAKSVDAILRGLPIRPEIRVRLPDGKIEVSQKALEPMPVPTQAEVDKMSEEKGEGPVRIYPFGVNRQTLERSLRSMQLPAVVAKEIDEADLVLTVKSKARAGTKIMRSAEERNIQVHVIKKNVSSQMIKFLRFYFNDAAKEEAEAVAMREVEEAIETVKKGKKAIDLNPQNAYIRRLQHNKADEAGLHSESVGDEPKRRVRLYP
ncbi:single-stranded DNA-binding protein [candidate division WOR-1 bacterium RIFOXYA12_FULL_52_29]|uniref:Single-stranded DNA-binding protein n=1 Tax=candidate division WOR-1 bacterium RIFOXYC12_FULL_54_18 TaxID=1802584 RepID=A0A1F4T890_UNCSA|nr:MAG: single-stranded DNA-binding protein [candidate division WOR-1 bacterium RIFOXYA2_FULL_51_19]OGC18343.1 MAG: single-stranded DNA-binding protein [candidate division WOR-1 bacterium RIFOXYA12_FULL_52_29]OGC27198.1 MAG: single-stranded DNA-binding protein [candidate division WOR-1 bacterium RIFOXYB2_FULL_45_9]OGC28760.1 MAG: single-stranded DNA-binding protein [candidate division WOR-1 bacterium RIFOXYC12_FULL_54_18]OGC30785.1 MAG: single-stranded DNA-binding protein [candidate division WO